MEHPQVIQGGMGVGVSSWKLAHAVSKLGQLGVVSGTALDILLARRLQDGDPGGHMRRALAAFPFRGMADRVRDRYFIEGGKPEGAPYRTMSMPTQASPRELVELCIVANFVEVYLAREGHSGDVGINYLEKVQMPLLPSLYGAMLAGVATVLIGAGIPFRVPGVLDLLSRHEPSSYVLSVAGAREGEETLLRFTPRDYAEGEPAPLARPAFYPIVSSSTLALTLARRSNGRVDGFVVEGHTAGGHNAPPRGKLQLTEDGQPVYGERDSVDLAKMKDIGLPFWVAGGRATPEALRAARAAGAAGVQVGTAFAFCEESGLAEETKARILADVARGSQRVTTDRLASPTGFPFKVADVAGSLSEEARYAARPRVCDLGYLREAYRKDDATLGYRCAAEPVAAYVAKGGREEETRGRKCLCNALVAGVGHGQARKGIVEEPIVTTGDDLAVIARFLRPGAARYSARDVLEHLLG